jgi:hypothetical protein
MLHVPYLLLGKLKSKQTQLDKWREGGRETHTNFTSVYTLDTLEKITLVYKVIYDFPVTFKLTFIP